MNRAASWLSPAAVAKVTGGRVVRTGRPALRVVTDSRQVGPDTLFVALRGANFDGHDFVPGALRAGAAGVVVERPLEGRVLGGEGFVVRVADCGRALIDLGRSHRERRTARVVGITGSCGKTSTKDMLGFALSGLVPTVFSPKSFNNHIGVPLSLLAIRPETEVAVVEIGTNAPGEIAGLTAVAQPDIGILTCVREAHLAGLGTLEGVAAEKAELLRGLRPGGVAIVNGDDPACAAIAETLGGEVRRFRVQGEADWFATDLRFHGLGTSFRLHGVRRGGGEWSVTLPRLGTHNVLNAMASIAAAAELGVPVDDVVAALAGLPASERRLEPKSVGGVQIFDDTYNMNPASARAALHALSSIDTRGRKTVVFGEMKELGARSDELHREHGAEVAVQGVDRLVVVGSGARPIVDGAIARGMSAEAVSHLDSSSAVLDVLLAELEPGDLVLCKASRGVALDRLVDGLVRALGGDRDFGGSI
ncbi:MAG: UDP-N-acetylmuramoyl-tripeptide--D-alanyl-D-alanine ligase [Planctomycetota bacterium]